MNRMKLLLYAVCFAALVGCSPKYGVGDYYEAEGVRGVVFSVTDAAATERFCRSRRPRCPGRRGAASMWSVRPTRITAR